MSESCPRDPELRRELLARRDRDQEARHAYAATERDERDWSPVAAVDADNLAFLAPLIERHAWLGSDLVGVDGAHACWLLVQHAPADQQDAWLPLMERAVAGGTASARDHRSTPPRSPPPGHPPSWPNTDTTSPIRPAIVQRTSMRATCPSERASRESRVSSGHSSASAKARYAAS